MITNRIFLAVCVALLTYIVNRWYRQRCTISTEDRWAAGQGCLPPAKLYTGRWPLGLGFIIVAAQAAKAQRLLHTLNNLIFENGMTFEQTVLGDRAITTVDPMNIEAVLSKQFNGHRRLVFFPLLGDGIFTQDGRAWEHSRALLRPTFLHGREQALTAVVKATEDAIASIPLGAVVDLQPVFFRLTMASTMTLLFGHTAHSPDKADAVDADSFANAFDNGQQALADRGRIGSLYWVIDGFHFREQCRIVHGFVDAAVDKALSHQNERDGKPGRTILGDLVEGTNDRRALRDQCLNILLAGRDTTACLLAWTFRLLARHPPALQSCRAEIAAVCGDVSPTRTDIKKIRYLDAVLKEGKPYRFTATTSPRQLTPAVLRLYPSVPINARTVNRTTTLPTGGGPDGTAPILLRKGGTVGWTPYVMHRRKDIFGEDAGIFRPERWLENGGRLVAEAIYGYLPFNAGPRVCLGQEFALLEASFVVVRFLQAFTNISLPGDEPEEAIGDERQKLMLVLSSAKGCRVVLS